MKVKTIKTRKDMALLLNDRMNKTYETLTDRQELEIDTSLVKTYLVEAHSIHRQSHNDIQKLIQKTFTKTRLKASDEIVCLEGDEEFFFIIKTALDKEKVTIYIDATDPRFWLLHSMESSISLDKLYDRLTTDFHEFDNVWILPQLLEEISNRGSLRGLGLDYDRREVPDVDFESEKAPVEFMKMQLWGNQAGKVLKILRHENAFPHSTTLSKVKVKYWSSDDRTNYAIDDIKFNGKITSRGTSFNTHISLTTELYRIYKQLVTNLEKHYALSFQAENSKYKLNGYPLNFYFNQPIADLEKFCESIFSCSFPFKLWGVPIPVNNNFIRVSGFDLHTGAPINFEITHEYIRVYLPKGTCGNSVARFYTNLQHFYDSLITVEAGDGKRIFEF